MRCQCTLVHEDGTDICTLEANHDGWHRNSRHAWLMPGETCKRDQDLIAKLRKDVDEYAQSRSNS